MPKCYSCNDVGSYEVTSDNGYEEYTSMQLCFCGAKPSVVVDNTQNKFGICQDCGLTPCICDGPFGAYFEAAGR